LRTTQREAVTELVVEIHAFLTLGRNAGVCRLYTRSDLLLVNNSQVICQKMKIIYIFYGGANVTYA